MMRSPLHARHQAMGAKFAEFGGWEMPLEYAGGGVVKEHQAVRERVGVFDVSHLGKARVAGPGAAAYVDATLTNALSKIGPGRAQYTLCCDEETGGIVDDLICYLVGQDEVFLVPNAANCAEVVRRLDAQAPAGVTVANLHQEYAILAVQGPRSAELLRTVGLPAGHAYMSFVEAAWPSTQQGPGGTTLTVCRTGYTGEHGYELVIPAAAAGDVWDRLLEAGAAYGVLPCGLGARDTLRTEMGYPLHGQDISLDVTPVQARLGWAVGWQKPAFWGRAVLLAEREAGPARRLRGLEATGRGIPRPGMEVFDSSGDRLGHVTSGTFSPTRRVGIGLALLRTGVPDGAEVMVDIRGRRQPFVTRRPPFVDASPTS